MQSEASQCTPLCGNQQIAADCGANEVENSGESEGKEIDEGCGEVRCALGNACIARLPTFVYNAIQKNNCEFLKVSKREERAQD